MGRFLNHSTVLPRMKKRLLTIFNASIIFTCLVGFCYGYTTYSRSDCGAKGGYCQIECRNVYITSINSYDLLSNVCVMTNLNYNKVAQNETEMDLSGRTLSLRHLPNSLYGVRTSQINSLNVSGNNFHRFDSYRYHNTPASGGTSLSQFVDKFDNLTTLDMSSTISKKLVAGIS